MLCQNSWYLLENSESHCVSPCMASNNYKMCRVRLAKSNREVGVPADLSRQPFMQLLQDLASRWALTLPMMLCMALRGIDKKQVVCTLSA